MFSSSFSTNKYITNFHFSGTPCGVCSDSIPLRLGKQAYSCRDCGLVAHKPCHVNVAEHCEQTSVPSMEL